jgi:hypothetical protein
VLKKIKLNRRGQATVEYLLFIVVISSLVAGLASYNGVIEQKFKDSKLSLRNKLAGNYELTRKDFFSGKIGSEEERGLGAGGGGGGGGDGSGGAGDDGSGGGGGRKGKKKPIQKQTAGKGGGTGTGSRGGDKAIEDKTAEGSNYQRQKMQRDDEIAIAQSTAAAQQYEIEQETPEQVYKEKEKEAISERQLALVSEKDRARLLKKAKDEGITTDKEKAMEQRNWKIGKIIIIIMILLFFIVIILKSRQNRD